MMAGARSMGSAGRSEPARFRQRGGPAFERLSPRVNPSSPPPSPGTAPYHGSGSWSFREPMTEEKRLHDKYAALAPVLDERQCRLWAAAEALALGRGGVSQVARATGLSRQRLQRGIRELEQLAGTNPAAVRRSE